MRSPGMPHTPRSRPRLTGWHVRTSLPCRAQPGHHRSSPDRGEPLLCYADIDAKTMGKMVEHLVGQVLLQGELRTAGLLRRHEDLHLRERERQKAQILQQPTPSREWVGGHTHEAKKV